MEDCPSLHDCAGNGAKSKAAFTIVDRPCQKREEEYSAGDGQRSMASKLSFVETHRISTSFYENMTGRRAGGRKDRPKPRRKVGQTLFDWCEKPRHRDRDSRSVWPFGMRETETCFFCIYLFILFCFLVVSTWRRKKKSDLPLQFSKKKEKEKKAIEKVPSHFNSLSHFRFDFSDLLAIYARVSSLWDAHPIQYSSR